MLRNRTAALAATAAILVAGVTSACSGANRVSLPASGAPVANETGQAAEPAAVVPNDSASPEFGSTSVTPVAEPQSVISPAISGPAPAFSRAARRPPPAPSGPGPSLANQANNWAVLVGISHYQGNTEPTYGGDGDVAAFQTMLQQAGWDQSHILVVTDGAATAQGIRSAMRWLVDHSSPTSFTLFHYSGHVCKVGRGPCQGPEKYLWPSDNALISDVEFGQAMSGLRGWSWIDVAGCEAGAFDEGLSGPQRLFTGSSQASETSYEYPPWRESVWAGMLVDQGMLHGEAGQGSGPISVQQAVGWATQQTENFTSDQSAGEQHPYANGGSGNWFLGTPAPAQQSGQPAPPPPPSGGPSSSPPTSAPPPKCSFPFNILGC